MNEITPIKEDAIRRQFDQSNDEWCFSVIDVVSIVTKSSDPRNYWKVLKNRLKKGQDELVTQCNQLKMKANDGKFYLTDVANERTILKIIQLVSPAFVPAFTKYFDSLNDHNTVQVKLVKTYADPASAASESYPQSTVENKEMFLAIDGYIKNNVLFIKAFVAGADMENLLLSVTCNKVTITGERTRSTFIQDANYSDQELYWGKFSRTIDLPAEIEINLVEASEYHGLLSISLPLIDKSRTKNIKVKITK